MKTANVLQFISDAAFRSPRRPFDLGYFQIPKIVPTAVPRSSSCSSMVGMSLHDHLVIDCPRNSTSNALSAHRPRHRSAPAREPPFHGDSPHTCRYYARIRLYQRLSTVLRASYLTISSQSPRVLTAASDPSDRSQTRPLSVHLNPSSSLPPHRRIPLYLLRDPSPRIPLGASVCRAPCRRPPPAHRRNGRFRPFPGSPPDASPIPAAPPRDLCPGQTSYTSYVYARV